MNVHEYIEKRASLRQKYLKGVERISDAISGNGPNFNPRSLKIIPAKAFEAVAAPIGTAKHRIEFSRNAKNMLRDIDKEISKETAFQRSLNDPLTPDDLDFLNLTPDDLKRVKDETSQYLSELKDMKTDMKVLKRNQNIGTGIGYGTLAYGTYKGGQKVKKYLQDKKRGQ